MRNIAIIKKCLDSERELILSYAGKEDKILFFDNEEQFINSEDYTNVEIVFGEPEYSTIQSMKKLRWIQMSWAGVNKYTSIQNFPDDIIVTNAAGAYGSAVSEYVITGILALIRKIFLYREQVKKGGWNQIEGDDTLEGKRVLILGTGNIGQETAKKLNCFGVHTVGICRNLPNRELPFDEIYAVDKMDEELKSADVIVIALPGTTETAGMFGMERIKMMK